MITFSFPSSDSRLLTFSQNFLNLITATPTAYGLVAGDATAYALVHAAYATALAACDPTVRSRPAVLTKNQARANLKSSLVLLASKVYSTSTVTDAQKTQLGFPPRATPVVIPRPTAAPTINVPTVAGWTAHLRLGDSMSGAPRGKPPGVSGAAVFSYVGATPPTEVSAWTFEGNTGRAKFDIAFPSTLAAGTQVWVTAFWFNNRKQSGPLCAPVSIHLQGGTVSMAA